MEWEQHGECLRGRELFISPKVVPGTKWVQTGYKPEKRFGWDSEMVDFCGLLGCSGCWRELNWKKAIS